MEIDMTYGEDLIEDIAENMLIGLGCNTEANQMYLTERLEELVSYVKQLLAEKDVILEPLKNMTSIEDDRDTIEL